jgi:1,2-diacylglycerol 3-beta-glucosyltransferase
MKISIIVAARNEEHNILACLQSLAALEYPTENLEILIGDDQSTDKTAEIVRNFITVYPHFRLIMITPSPILQGKTNALAQLCQQATGEWLVFTDADMILPTTWLQKIVEKITPTTGVIVGCTVPQPTHFWAILQTLDWALYLGVIHSLSLLRIPITGMGNNMAVAQRAYQEVGGYENLPFSLTEDYRLFKAIVTQGFDFQQLYDKDVLGITQAVPTWQGLLHQRQRWLAEFKEFSVGIKIGIFWQGLFVFLLFLLACVNPLWAVAAYLVRFLVNVGVLSVYLYKLKLLKYIFYVFFYDIFSLLFYAHLLISLFGQKKYRWKGRSFAAMLL